MLTVASVSNFHFWQEAGYFDIAASFKPLLHTWSLAVEEQFYVVWPLFLVLTVARFGKGGARYALAIVGAASLAGALVMHDEHPSAVFFLTPFRVHQFAIGGLLALSGLGQRSSITEWSTVIGLLILVIVGMTAAGEETPYMYAALLPACAAGLVIWSSNSSLAEGVLASAPAVWLGRRSYSIYLAHWPIIILWKLGTDFSFSITESVVVLFVSIAIGALLHGFVEEPFRFGASASPLFRAQVLTGVAVLAAFVLGTGALYHRKDGFPERTSPDILVATKNMNSKWKKRQIMLRTGECNLPINTFTFDTYNWTKCFTSSSIRKSYFIIGDSFASDAYMVMREAYPDVHFGQLTLPGCQLRTPSRFKSDSECKKLYALAIEKLANGKKYDGIVLASNWPLGHYYRIDDFLEIFKSKSMEIILIGQHIRFHGGVPTILQGSLNMNSAVAMARTLIRTHERQINNDLRKKFRERLKFIDFMQLQCPGDCDILDEQGNILYLDDSHISVEGAAFLAKRMRDKYSQFIGK